MSQRKLGPHDDQSIYWSLRADKRDLWWDDIQKALGMDKDVVKFTRVLAANQVPDRTCGLSDHPEESCDYKHWWFSAPSASGFDKEDVTNPKKVISEALDKLKSVGPDIDILVLEIAALQYDDSPEDLVEALAMPILMIGEAVKAMREVVKTADEIKEAEEKEFILNFLSAVLFIVPVVGSALASVGLGTLGRILGILGEVGQAAMGVYDVASNPDSAPMAIFGLILGAAGIRDAGKVSQAAKYRRDMSPDAIGKLGGDIKVNLDKIGKVVKKTCVR